MKRFIPLLIILACPALAIAQSPPRLIVQIVIDQLRGDLIHQYQADFGNNGFNWLLNHGLDFQSAQHPHAYTITCIGHATIATGAYPAMHGIIGNEWFDRDNGKDIYCVGDDSSAILPTDRSKVTLEGRSPRNLLASTFSDELVLSQRGRAFAVSFKDRAAVTLAGHAGKAFWFDRENGGFVTSQHYYSAYPDWVTQWNQTYEPKEYIWKLDTTRKSWRFASARFMNAPDSKFGNTFPHKTGSANQPGFYKRLSMTPVIDELTAEFALKLLKEEKLGLSENKTDYLAISFSATDAIGHQFGPKSLESEANLLHLDKTIATLLAGIDQQAGLNNTLIVLSADHGISDNPDWLKQHGIRAVQGIDDNQVRSLVEAELAKRFNLPAQSLQAIRLPYVYLNHQVISEHNVELGKVNSALAEMLNQQKGLFRAYPLPMKGIEYDWLSSKVDKMAMPNRAGDLYLVQLQYQLADTRKVQIDHGTPWRYDSYVPLLFASGSFKPQRLSRAVLTNDIAPTLSAILQIKAPTAAVSQPLPEVMANFESKANFIERFYEALNTHRFQE